MFNFNETLSFDNKELDVFTIGELLVTSIVIIILNTLEALLLIYL